MNFKLIFSKDNALYVMCFCLVVLFYQLIYGLNTINPSNINWLMSVYHDWGTHYLGWCYYRNEPWTMPLGNIENLYFPVGTNVGFTDSAPLFALFFKFFSGIIPENFQYFGMLLFTCHLLVAFFTLKILKLYTNNVYYIILSVTLITINPVLVFRGIHPALSVHFLILASIYNYLKYSTRENAIKINLNQVFVFFIAVTINPYIAMMILGFNIVIPIKHYIFDHSITLKKTFFYPILAITSGLLFWIAFGMINLSNSTSTNLASADNFRQYSFNLNSFFNSYGFFSKILPDFGMVNEKQYEGFAYFGFGILILIFLTIIYFILTFKKSCIIFFEKKKIIPVIILCFGLFIFSMSCQISFGKKVLFEYPIPKLIETLGFVFRASGRFVWPLYYLSLISLFIIITKIDIKNILRNSILTIITCIQIYDIQTLLTKNDLPSGDYHTKLQDDKWILLFKNFDEIITYPCFNTTLLYHLDYQDFCFLALKAKKPITNGYVARDNITKVEQYRNSLTENINNGKIANQIFITTPSNIEDFSVLISQSKVKIKKLDGFVLIYPVEKNLDEIVKNTKSDDIYLDSIVKFYKNAKSYKVVNKNISESNDIEYNFDNYIDKGSFIQMNGWAALKNSSNNIGDSIFIALNSSEDKMVIVPPILVKRSDVTISKQRGNLDDSGFKTTIFTNKVEKGIYNVNILIKDKSGKVSITKTSKVIKVSKPLVKEVTFSKDATNKSDKIYVQNSKLNLELFSPIFSKNNSGLLFFENSITKSNYFNLKKGEYILNVQGISYPSTPLKGENAHFKVKISDLEIGQFSLSEKINGHNPKITFKLEKDSQINIQLEYDNDDNVKGKDRNALITNLEITQK